MDRVEASDAGANSRTWPPPSDVDGTPQQVTNMLYQVDETFDPNARWVPGSQPIYFVIMKETERAELADIGDADLDGKTGFGSEAMSNAQMNATFISMDGRKTDIRYGVLVRNRGHGTRRNSPNNMRVNFRHDQPWLDVTAINLNTQYPYNQLVGSALFRLAGLPVAVTRLVHVRVNGQDLANPAGSMYGFYAHVEVLDSDFVENRFPTDDKGNLYKCMRNSSQADLSYRGDHPDAYRANYFKNSHTAQLVLPGVH